MIDEFQYQINIGKEENEGEFNT